MLILLIKTFKFVLRIVWMNFNDKTQRISMTFTQKYILILILIKKTMTFSLYSTTYTSWKENNAEFMPYLCLARQKNRCLMYKKICRIAIQSLQISTESIDKIFFLLINHLFIIFIHGAYIFAFKWNTPY